MKNSNRKNNLISWGKKWQRGNLWSKNQLHKFMKTGRISAWTHEALKYLFVEKLKGKLDFIKEQEILHEENLIDFDNKAKIAAESGNMDKSETEIEIEPYSKYAPKEINTDENRGKGFAGTSLMLFPNVRNTKLEIGEECSFFKLFGISKKKGTIISMYLGPNGRQNKYLVKQYKRLFGSIDGTVKIKSHFDKELSTKVVEKYVEWQSKLKNIHVNAKSTHPLRKMWRYKTRKFWAIGLNLLNNSTAFRVVLMTSVLGKTGRWYHRDIAIAKLVAYNRSYTKIVNRQETRLPIQRKWIPSGDKFRPLGISPIAWRIYTKGMTQLLSTFLANSWPENQHGYTKKRGVQTAWYHILHNVIKKRNIFEYDLVGYFNNIKHSIVVRQLDRFQVPKYVMILLIELNCGPVKSPTLECIQECVRGQDWDEIHPRQKSYFHRSTLNNPFVRDFEKHEYLHKYRRGWRDRGFPQGGSLSPLLSILPLILTENIGNEIENTSYCDDGLLCSDKLSDMLKILQQLFDTNGAGVKVHQEKSGWVKRDGEWLKCLKFVGLKYDPFTDILAASTRKGSVLPMQIDSVGLLTKESKTYTNFVANAANCDTFMPDFSCCPYKNMPDPWLPEWKRITRCLEFKFNYEMEKVRWNEWHFYTILKWIVETDASYLPDITFRLLGNDCGLWQYYRNIEALDGNRAKWILDDLEKFFTTEVPWREIWRTVKMVLEDSNKLAFPIICKEKKSDRMALSLDLLIWHKNMIRHSISSLLENGTDIGVGNKMHEIMAYKLDPLSALSSSLPDSMLNIAVKHNWNISLYVSRLCWRNVIDTRYLGTLVSRLFIGSFSSDKVKQNFKLTFEKDSLVDLGFSYYCNREWASVLHNEQGITVFNSTTIYSFILNKMMELWDKGMNSKKHIRTNTLWHEYYYRFVERLIKRRVGKFSRANCNYQRIIPQPHIDLDDPNCLGANMQAKLPSSALIGLPPSAKHIKSALLKSKRAFKDGIPVEAITHLSSSENAYKEINIRKLPFNIQLKLHFEPLQRYRNSCPPKPKGTNWFTWASPAKGPRAKRPIPIRRTLNIRRYAH